MEVIHQQSLLHGHAAPLDLDQHAVTHVIVERRGQGHEFRGELTVDAQQDVSRLQKTAGTSTRDDLLNDEKTRLVRKSLAHCGFGLLCEAQSPQLRVRLVDEFTL